ncbi:MAG TPA: signal peptide peptidase SppA [Vicinamibacterales bacterium]|nr:signal peptide peptidase SppA [Vicinamibacterales bacterium]
MAVRRGVWLVLALVFVAVMISATGLLVTALIVGREPQVASNSVLTLEISGDLQEVEPFGMFGPFMEPAATVRGTVEMLRKAKVDRRVTGVILRPAGTSALWAKVQEVRDAILDFRSSGKPIVAYLEQAGDQEFFLASACDKVFLMPTASLDLTGIASYELFLRGTLDKMGVFPDVLHVGDFKTAGNTYTERTFTPAHREMTESLNRDLYEQLVRGLAEGRRKSDAEMRALIDHGPYLPEDAIRAGLIDDVAYIDEVDDKVQLGGGDLKFLTPSDYRRVSAASLGLNKGPRVAVLYAVGMITTGRSSADGIQTVGSETFVEEIRKIRADKSIKAVVLRIDSPGGSAIASDVIWRELMLTREVKPVIASMSDVAASGGYYIAMPAHAIVAEPATLTGSIGVVMVKFVLEGTLDKVGANLEGVTSGEYADLYSPVRRFSPDERRKIEALMQATYEAFVEKAAAGRKTTPERIDAIAQGRVWTGQQAKDLGLVDELGGLQRALAVAKTRANIDPDAEVELVVYPQRRSFYELIQSPFGAEAGGMLRAFVGLGERRAVEALTAPLRLFRRGEPLMLMPNIFVR